MPEQLERRRSPRRQTAIPALVRLDDGTEMSCMIRDVSKGGARLGVAPQAELPNDFYLVMKSSGQAMPVRLIWRQGNYAGISIHAA
ncbi:PilZ domain-containing protein [Methylobacterium sp. A54F]